MPWTGQEFKTRHAHHLSSAQADSAAHMANAMLKAGVPEGEAIATAIKHAEGHHHQLAGHAIARKK